MWKMAPRRFTARQNQRYIAIKYSVRGRDLGSTVEEAIAKVNQRGQASTAGYHHRLGRRIPKPKARQ